MSKFNIWVDDSHLNNVMSYDEFVADTQRTAGFTGGTPASSVRVNSALRQANLVACALMNIVDPGNTVDFRSSVNSIQSLISTYLTTTLTVNKATNVDVSNLNTGANATVNFRIGNGVAYNKTINNVSNVTTSINNKAITDIFETNGTTVKNSTNAAYAQYASTDTSKGTIEERLTSLGFKQTLLTADGRDTSYVSSVSNLHFERMGNIVLVNGELRLTSEGATALNSPEKSFCIGSLPAEFMPRFYINTYSNANTCQMLGWRGYTDTVGTNTVYLQITEGNNNKVYVKNNRGGDSNNTYVSFSNCGYYAIPQTTKYTLSVKVPSIATLTITTQSGVDIYSEQMRLPPYTYTLDVYAGDKFTIESSSGSGWTFNGTETGSGRIYSYTCTGTQNDTLTFA